MCVYKRTIFSCCNHSQWSSSQPFRVCDHQKSNISDKISGACTEAKGHPLATVKVDGKCSQCAGSHKSINEKFQKAKDIISQNKKTLIGADSRCQVILEDVGVHVNNDINVGGCGEEVDEMETKEVTKTFGEKGLRITAEAEFMKKRKQGEKAKWFIG